MMISINRPRRRTDLEEGLIFCKGGVMKRSIFVLSLVLMMSSVGFGATIAQAQPYPNRPIQLVVPLPPGAQGDVSARILADEMAKILGTQIIVVNKPGAALTLGTDAVVRSKKDGYTVVYTSSGALVYARVINPEAVPYNPSKDLEPLGVHLFYPLTATVQEGSPWKTLPELVDYAKKNPGKLRVKYRPFQCGNHSVRDRCPIHSRPIQRRRVCCSGLAGWSCGSHL
ncbi:MAG: hypothetical protein H6Q41_6065 [Deltaproteobacteria bacterium]|nr:hypothetical protein [Deltaproteobacteria bacterium]